MEKSKKVLKIVLIIWAVVASGYVIFSMWNDFKINFQQKVYQAGVSDTVNSLIKQANDSKCEPFEVYNGDNKTQLISVSCLQKEGDQGKKTVDPTPNK